jgi:hypothetical protein
VNGALGMHERTLPGIRQLVHQHEQGEVLVNLLDAGALLPVHAHPESQLGFALGRGHFQLTGPGGSWRVDDGLGYVLAPGAFHGALHPGATVLMTVDVKRRLAPGTRAGSHRILRKGVPGPNSAATFDGGWCQVRWYHLGPGDPLPLPAARLTSPAAGHRLLIPAQAERVRIQPLDPAMATPPDAPREPEALDVLDILYR